MGLTSALNTSLNGLQLNETSIDVLGNNIANAGTNGFKGSRVLFSTQLTRTLSSGSAPSGNNGGTNPKQIGLGATTSAIQLDFNQGSITNSTSPSDLAIQGDGFFIVDGPDGAVYTRNGNFILNSSNILSSSQGLQLQGYGVDDNFELVTTQLTDLRVPLGELQVAAATRNASIAGALLPSGDVATRGTLLTSAALVSDGVGTVATGATLLTDVRLASSPGTTLIALGETLNLTPEKGGRTLDSAQLNVTGTTTVADFLAFVDGAYGLQGTGSVDFPIPTDADGIPVGGSINASGQLLIKGNRGTVNDIDFQDGSLLTSNSIAIPLGFSKGANTADGESTVTTFTVFNSLGESVPVRMSAVLESRQTNETTYRYFLETVNEDGNPIEIGNSVIQFNSQGEVMNTPDNVFSINLAGTAAANPLEFTLDLSSVSGISSTAAGSTLSLVAQDGSEPGTLTSFLIDERGIVNGIFDNGINRTLGQVVLGRFANPQGLLQAGSDTFRQGVASGLPLLTIPGTFGAGTVRSGAIELSNVDIGRNLVDLIVASTNYRGNARVISSVQELVDELLILGR